MNLEGRRWISVREAADYLGCHIQTCYRLLYLGQLPGARVGRSVRIDLKKLQEQLEAQARRPERGQA
jgi:excisionase family DNA binding protein